MLGSATSEDMGLGALISAGENTIGALNAEGIPVFSGYTFPLYKNPMFLEKKLMPAVAGHQRLPSGHNALSSKNQLMWVDLFPQNF